MTGHAAGKLKEAIRHRIACIDRPTINAFAGTGTSRRRELQATHSIARQIVDQGLHPFSFHWDHGNREPGTRHDVYLTVFTALFDIDDEDARRWSSKTEWDAARAEATRDIVSALMRKFVIGERRTVTIRTDDYVGSHSLSATRYEDEL